MIGRRNLRRPGWGLLATVALVCLLIGGPSSGVGQEGSGGQLESAGDEARFRVIERFPDESSAESPEAGSFNYRVSDELVEAMRRRDWGGAAGLLGDQEQLADADRRLLQGYIAYRRQMWEEARTYLTAAAARSDELTDYASFYAARAALKTDDPHRAVLSAARVGSDSRLYGDALDILARAHRRADTSTDRGRARDVMAVYLKHFPSGEHARTMHLRLAESLLEEEAYEQAAEHLWTLRRRYPLSSAADRATALLEEHRDAFPEDLREAIDSPPTDVVLARFRALYDAHESRDLIDQIAEPLDEWTPGTRQRCRGLYWMAKSHTKLRKHDEALPWYQRVLDECSGIPHFEKKALYMGGKSAWNAGERQTALKHFETLWSTFDDHSYADDVMYFAARIYREMDRLADAEALLAKQVERYPTGDMADNAHWLRVRSMIGEEEWRQVVDYVESLEQTGEDGPNTAGRLAYFRGRALQKLGENSKARDAYRSVADEHPLGYYALLALNRLSGMAGEGGTGPICASADDGVCGLLRREGSEGEDDEEISLDYDIPEKLRKYASYRKGTRLLSLGIRDWAEAEFDRLFDRVGGDRSAILGMANMLDRAGSHTLAHRLPARFGVWRERYPDPQTRRAWTIAYPDAFRDRVESWAAKRDLADAFVWAIIRKESGYNATIKSWANARGLMQLMPDTARQVAKKDGLSGFGLRDLLDPSTNIRLGTAYLGGLSESFDGHPALVAAGYNGGRGNINRWLDERGELPVDLWIEDIPYGQTRRYAKVVLANYWTYRWLYEDGSTPRIPFRFGGK